MRQIRFIFTAILTSLLVINAVFLRRTSSILLCGLLSFNSASCYSLLNQSTAANASIPPAKQVDLTGIWIGKGSKFTLDQRGCTAGYVGQLTANGQDADQGTEITVTQKGNQLIIPDQKITYSGSSSGGYTQHNQGTISGNKVKLISSANASFGNFIIESTGTISDDGNAISGEMFCKNSPGSATAKGRFTWTKLQPSNVNLTGTWVGNGTVFTIDGRGCTAGQTGTFLINGKEPQGFVFPLTQSGNQWTTPPVTTTSGNGVRGTESTQGYVTGNTVIGTDEGTVGGGVTIQLTGTVSADGNKVTGTSICKTNAGLSTAKGTFTWTRRQPAEKELLPEPGDLLTYQVDDDKYAHVAVIIAGGVTKNLDGTATITRVRSKWGGGAVYDHDPNQTLSYGKKWTVWRRILKKKGCTPEECNWLDIRQCHSWELGYGDNCFKTDKNNNIRPGGCLGKSEGPLGLCRTTGPDITFTTNEQPLPGVDRVELPKNPLLYDCRGFVFGSKLAPISEHFLPVDKNQVQEILDDGYVQIHAKDTEGKQH